MKKEYKIAHIDPLGQGVSKEESAITFIKKTLPNEIVEAEVFSKKKGVEFAQLTNIISSSPARINPDCVHFNECNGCDYQHTEYKNELEFKKAALKRHLFKFPETNINIHSAKKRYGYRNRIQLHYDKKKRALGLLNAKQEIISVSDCIIIEPKVSYEIKKLYLDKSWLKLVAKEPITGHIEIYAHPKEGYSQITVNKPYAFGGFTQVNQHMNNEMLEWINQKAKELIDPNAMVYDLFGGNGNISAGLSNKTLVVDAYKATPTNTKRQFFYSQNLYNPDALKNLIHLKSNEIRRPEWIIFDPPRSGLKNIKEYLNEFKPKGFIFIACDPSSFARDLKDVFDQYEIHSLELFDLFPGTQHFETIGIFTRR